jgi:hypothetical protein
LSDIPRLPAAFFERYVPEHMARLGGAFAGRSSPGAIAFDVTGAGSWSLRLKDGSIDVSSGIATDALFRNRFPGRAPLRSLALDSEFEWRVEKDGYAELRGTHTDFEDLPDGSRDLKAALVGR